MRKTQTGFFFDERCLWHSGGGYAFTLPVGGLVQPLAAGGLPEDPETKRRFKNLLEVTGLIQDLDVRSAAPVTTDDLVRIHSGEYLGQFKQLSDKGGGEIGLRAPFAQGGYELAALSAGLVKDALIAVLEGKMRNAYALARPPGHHCLPDFPNGFCLLANIAIAIEAARSAGLCNRVAVLDWDVHHGNGTEAIFYERADVLAVSLHQEHNYPLDTGYADHTGNGPGEGFNINIPLPPGGGHALYLEAMERLVLPALRSYEPDVIVVACGFDAAAVDPLGRMLATAETFRAMTQMVMELADDICEGRLIMAHEGGYSEVYVPFCGHYVLQQMSGSKVVALDPLGDTLHQRQPSERVQQMHSEWVDDLVAFFGA